MSPRPRIHPRAKSKRMAIERGEDWGAAGAIPAGTPQADTDAALADLCRAGASHAIVTAGDLARTLGIGPDRQPGAVGHLLPVDAIEVGLDDQDLRLAIAHVLVGHWLFDASQLALMNAAFVGPRNLAPRAHPGDGKLDVVTMEVPFADRVKGRRRQRLGTHIPHPGIAIRRRERESVTFARPQPVWLDGRRLGRVRRLSARIVPAAITVCV